MHIRRIVRQADESRSIDHCRMCFTRNISPSHQQASAGFLLSPLRTCDELVMTPPDAELTAATPDLGKGKIVPFFAVFRESGTHHLKVF
ncbi:hypothetical protein E2C01_041447 [Portunus trituberculatus]|uniref:Uncharacterized protein n=1 Tax=Portunus trituberculatus TaxID=210409 RepID=A0A5B7FRR0_PORTR|nr:hypothetical protein [Portunus trituberculatus]